MDQGQAPFPSKNIGGLYGIVNVYYLSIFLILLRINI